MMKLPKLIPIKYRRKKYPDDINATIQEVPGHFDEKDFDKKISQIDSEMQYSLHTEYSFGKRNFNSPVFSELELNALGESLNGVPRLWYNGKWSEQFFQFITKLVGENRPPKIIEIHPPFRDYCADMDTFLESYRGFENLVDKRWPESIIAIENRAESFYPDKFLVYDDLDIRKLLEKIEEGKYKLKLMLDIPQLFTALGGIENLNLESIKEAFQRFQENKRLIIGIHIWGRKNGSAHVGSLDNLFNSDINFKESFLKFLSDYFDDDTQRYVVPEVNSSLGDFTSIVNDLRKYFDLSAKNSNQGGADKAGAVFEGVNDVVR